MPYTPAQYDPQKGRAVYENKFRPYRDCHVETENDPYEGKVHKIVCKRGDVDYPKVCKPPKSLLIEQDGKLVEYDLTEKKMSKCKVSGEGQGQEEEKNEYLRPVRAPPGGPNNDYE